jgi:nicotinamide mononucleotide (NMN) deamidase PncC
MSRISGYPPAVPLEDMAASIAEALDGRSLATAESCTAGRLATAFAGVASASEWFKGALVAYQVAATSRLDPSASLRSPHRGQHRS